LNVLNKLLEKAEGEIKNGQPRDTGNCHTRHRTKTIRVITKLPNTEQSSKGKGKTYKSTNRQNQSTTGKLGKPQWPDLVQEFPKKWWVE